MITTSASTRPTIRRRTRRARAAIIIGVAVATVGTATAALAANASPAVHRWCTVTPAADGLPLGAYLVGMYRSDHDAPQVLHRIECSDHTITYKWIGGDFA